MQQSNKIKHTAFEAVFHKLNHSFSRDKTYKGYHLITHDGSKVNIFPDPNDARNVMVRNRVDEF